MDSRRSTRIIASYVLSLLVTITLLVYWVVYVVSSMSTINELAQRVGARGDASHVWVLVVGCVLFVVVIGGLTYNLAQALGARNYSRKQDEFVSNITHEMKSPLAAIKLHAQTLQQPDVSTDDVQRSVGFILQQAERMGSLIDNVLESSRLIARKKHLTLEPVRIKPFFEAFVQEQRGHVEARGVRLKADLASDAVVMATTEALRRITTNLIENAVRFSARGGEVRCRVSDDRSQVTIEVEDDGVGIPQGELPKVFDRFYQIGREISERRGGTGLGLSIVLGLVKEMKGNVHAIKFLYVVLLLGQHFTFILIHNR